MTALGDLAAGMITALRGPGRQLCYGYHADLDGLGILRHRLTLAGERPDQRRTT